MVVYGNYISDLLDRGLLMLNRAACPKLTLGSLAPVMRIHEPCSVRR